MLLGEPTGTYSENFVAFLERLLKLVSLPVKDAGYPNYLVGFLSY
jgi:hypothetical protein